MSSATATRFALTELTAAAEQGAGAPPVRPAVLGAFPAACYLRLPAGSVVALLTSDAVQLPIGVTLPWTSQQVSLAAAGRSVGLAPGRLRLGELVIEPSHLRDAALRPAGRPRRELLAILPVPGWPGRADPGATVAGSLGLGGGLTPDGDDLLCGALAAQALFGLPDDGLGAAVITALNGNGGATTSLSGQLLRRAVAGEGIPQLQHLAEALCGASAPAVRHRWQQLQRVGHSSGHSLGLGLLAGAWRAVELAGAA